MAYREIRVPSHHGPVHELLGFDPGQAIAGGVEGLSAFSIAGEQTAATMSELAVRSALQGGEGQSPATGYEPLDVQLAFNREFTDNQTHDAVTRAVNEQAAAWDRAITISLQAANIALLEATVFDVMGGFPSDREISKSKPRPMTGENMFHDPNHETHVLEAAMPISDRALPYGQAQETLTAKASFRKTSREEHAYSKADPLEPFYNRAASGRWRLERLVLQSRDAIKQVGLAATDKTIRSRRVWFRSDGLLPTGEMDTMGVGANINEGDGHGSVLYYYRCAQPSSPGPYTMRESVSAVRLTLNELRQLVSTGPATQQMLDEYASVYEGKELESSDPASRRSIARLFKRGS